MKRLTEWTDRARFSHVARAPLGFGTEYWDLDPTHYEGWEELRDRRAAHGLKIVKRDIAYDLASHLLNDLIVAAGGVERSITKLRETLALLNDHARQNGLREEGGVPLALSNNASVDAWYAFSDVLSWSRTVVERLERPPRDRKKFPSQGLVPALKPKRLKKRCEILLKQLRLGPVGEARPLANFVLHSALVNDPFSGVQVDANGNVSLRIPDSLPASHWYLLRWDQDRDGFAFAENLWQAVETLIDEILNAFEKSVPKRLRNETTS